MTGSVIRFGGSGKAGYASFQVHETLRTQALIQNVAHLLRARRFLPLFATQFLGAFNDNYDTSKYSIRNRYSYVKLEKNF